ncbi:dihydrodipicolinate synthase family protein [Defluviimonas salinarum]|uniref:Dihydrodipicolinate synthase family protein n=1 Tax=Defluviimonas salinarum TaxID=2992147 RepID=A0ABT3JAJ2_9RHOB|nr:dihydrodipicolinate synthase family protein [Defluviimonas salinarum]MCW3784465.1 dihydrodipicolinate synthase family protein [Defluviimonas salinarum]
MSNLEGINLAMQTPLNADGAIDFAVFERLIEDYIAAGVQGLVLGAGTGQHPYLTEDECNRLYEAGIKQIAGRVNVICQTSALNMDEVIRRSRHAENSGANALMILPPYLEGPDDEDGLFAFYREIDAAVGIDIVGYNIPQSTGIAVSVPLLLRLKELRNYRWIKDSAGDFTTHQEYLQTGIDVLNGCDTTTFAALMAGTKGVIWGAANYMPHEAAKLYGLITARDLEAALVLWQKMLPSLLFIWRNPYVPAVLRAAELRGFGTGNVRRPLQRLTAAQDAALQKALAPLMVDGPL